MNILLLFLTRMYSRLLRLYPARFRHEFSNEMQNVFDELAQETAKRGLGLLLAVFLRELGHLPGNLLLESWHEGFEPALLLKTVKEGTVQTIRKMRWVDVGSWQATLASLLPLWFLCLAMVMAFSQIDIPVGLVYIAFWLFPILSLVFIGIGWMTFEVLLYSLFPILLQFSLDETSMAYRITLIVACTVFLSIGIVGYHISLNRDKIGLAWLILLLVFIATWFFASRTNQNYWQMADALGYYACDNNGCAPLIPKSTSWWILFFRVISGY
jgi:hypothetical protein